MCGVAIPLCMRFGHGPEDCSAHMCFQITHKVQAVYLRATLLLLVARVGRFSAHFSSLCVCEFVEPGDVRDLVNI